jgi:menaquinone-dependent protoporphyrinogen oxidase
MCEVPVLYATTEGQTQRIAERLAHHLRERGFDAEAFNVDSPTAAAIAWDRTRGIALGASLHMQRHQSAARRFALQYRDRLAALPSLFFSVSLSAASKIPGEREAAQRLAEALPLAVGWEPWRVASVAGRLAYSRYGWLVRWFMRRIALKEGASGDMTRDHEYTDWAQVAQLADDFAAEMRARETIVPTRLSA